MQQIQTLKDCKNGQQIIQDVLPQKQSLGERVCVCEFHGSFKAIGTVIFGIPLWTKCPQCKNESEIDIETKQQSELHEQNLITKNVPDRYRESTLKNYVCETQEQKNLVQFLADHIRSPKRRNLIIHGKKGTGKTHLMWAVVKAIPGARLYKMSAIIRRVKVTFGCAAAKETEPEILAELSKVPLLVIDEVGRQGGTVFESNFIFDLLDDRYNNKLATDFISNLEVDGPLSISSFIGEAAMDRINQNSVDIPCDWDNWRETHSDD